MVDGTIVEEMRGDNFLDDLLLDGGAEILGGDIVAVLCGNDNGVDAHGLDCAGAVVAVLDGDLCLSIGSQPGDSSRLAGISHGLVESVCELDGEGEVFGCFVGSVAEHDTLITGT